eukprot:548481-Rhodomonas_salina.1
MSTPITTRPTRTRARLLSLSRCFSLSAGRACLSFSLAPSHAKREGARRGGALGARRAADDHVDVSDGVHLEDLVLGSKLVQLDVELQATHAPSVSGVARWRGKGESERERRGRREPKSRGGIARQ